MQQEEEDSDLIRSLPSRWITKIALIGIIVAIWTSTLESSAWSISLLDISISLKTVVIFVTLSITWIASLILLPLWIAYITDSRNARNHVQGPILSPVNLMAAHEQMTGILASLESPMPALHTSSKAVEALIEDVMSLVMRDFVLAWYAPLLAGSPDIDDLIKSQMKTQKFPNIIDRTIRSSLSRIIDRLNGIDLASLGVSRILPILTDHLKAFEAAEVQWRKSGSSAEIVEEEENEVFLTALYNGGHLHQALGNNASADTRLTELEYLRGITTRVLKRVLPIQEANSKGVFILAKEIIACTIMKTIIEVLSDPDTLNALLEERASAALQEQKLVSQLREALDRQGSGASSSKNAANSRRNSKRSTRSGETSFEHLLETINQSKSILEARRIKNGIMQQMRRAGAALAENSHIENKKKGMLSVYLQRLHSALEAVDHRMLQLGSASSSAVPTISTLSTSSFKEAISLTFKDVLTSSLAISHFLEFMEMRKRSIFVQFWMSVNTFKDPLEIAESDSDEESSSLPSKQVADQEQVKTLCEDLRFFNETYYQIPELAKIIGEKHVAAAREFWHIYGEGSSQVSIRSIAIARRSVVKAQSIVYEEMKEVDWPLFQSTATFHQAADDLKREKDHEVPTLKSSSSTFLEKAADGSKGSSRPSTSRAISHAHLFGLAELSRDTSSETASLFGDDTEDTGLRKGLRSQSSYDALLGGKGSAFDSIQGRTPLFREALFDEDEPSIQNEMSEKEAVVQVDKIDAIEYVLASLIKEDLPTVIPERPSIKRNSSSKSTIHSMMMSKQDQRGEVGGEVQTGSRSARSSPPMPSSVAHRTVMKSTSLDHINHGIKRLQDQEELLNTLIRKAELTGSSVKELKLLEKSKSAVAREKRELLFERKTAMSALESEQRERDDLPQFFPGRTRLQVKQAEINTDTDGKDFASYLIEVSVDTKQINVDLMVQKVNSENSWIISRRYNEFYLLHNRLMEKIVQVRALDHYFPGKRFTGQVNPTFLETRRISLQRYLQEIVRLDTVCKSIDFRTFFSQKVPIFTLEVVNRNSTITGASGNAEVHTDKGLVSRLYRGMTGVAGGLDDLLFGPSMYEIVVNRLSSGVVDLVGFNDMERVLIGTTTSSPAEIKEATQVMQHTSFTTPICDCFIELFQLKLDGNWFRRQAVIIVAQQALGGTIERRVRQSIQTAFTPLAIQGYISTIRNIMWPDGKLKQPGPARSIDEKRHRSQNALKKLSTLIPTIASTFVGRDNARRAARRSWAMLQNRRLNKHVIYSILDAFVDEIFPFDDENALLQSQ